MNKSLLYIAAALVIGLGAGYLLFGGSTASEEPHEHSTGAATDQQWTCSMHPQIMQDEPGDCPICGMDLIPAAASADGLTPEQFRMTENAMALANVQTTVVGGAAANTLDARLKLSGKIAVNQEANAIQASYFDGRIERLNVNFEGQEIGKGQLLATIYSPELVAAQQELITAASLKESQPQLYQAVRNKLKLWKLSESQINNIESSAKVQEYFPVYATVSGTVSQLMTSAGDYVKKGQPIAKLSNLNSVWAEFDVYESQLSQFKIGQQIRLTTNAYPNEEFSAKVSFIDPVLNNATRTVTVRATLNNKADKFKPGMFISGALENTDIQNTTETLLIPASAVLWTGESSVVYVKDTQQAVFEMREVKLGKRLGDSYEVLSGLKTGEQIVTNGTFTVDAAAQLQGKKSMMNKSGGKTMTGHEGHGMTNDHDMAKMELSSEFQSKFKKILTTYLELKDQFVSSEPAQIAKSANATLTALNQLTNVDVSPEVQSHLTEIKTLLKAIGNQQDLEGQRMHFVPLNEHLVHLVTNLNNLDNTIYVQRCPMANNNQGALWLSAEQEIRNPYFGDAMLKCGSVVETLQN